MHSDERPENLFSLSIFLFIRLNHMFYNQVNIAMVIHAFENCQRNMYEKDTTEIGREHP